MKFFALKHKETGNFAVFSASSNDGEFCTSVEFEIEQSTDGWQEDVWVTTSRETAEKVSVTNTDWFNAGFNSPINREAGKWEVVELVAA